MANRSTEEPEFGAVVEEWLSQGSEVSALIRYSRSAGSKDFEFFHSANAFWERVRKLPPLTSIIVFRKPQLPLRGVVDDEFVKAALASVPEGAEYLIAGLDQVSNGRYSFFRSLAGESHAELEDDLRGCLGERVAVGAYPPWLEDTQEVVSAIVPTEDGSIVGGVY